MSSILFYTYIHVYAHTLKETEDKYSIEQTVFEGNILKDEIIHTLVSCQNCKIFRT